MLANLPSVKVLQMNKTSYEEQERFYVMVGDGHTIIRFKVDKEVFESLQPYDDIDATIELFTFKNNLYASIKDAVILNR